MKLYTNQKFIYEDGTKYRDISFLTHGDFSLLKLTCGTTTGWFSEGFTFSITIKPNLWFQMSIFNFSKVFYLSFFSFENEFDVSD
jgi:hypothetical protein